MGNLLHSFTYPRNAFASTVRESATKTFKTIERARSGALRRDPSGEVKDEAFNDAQTFLGVVSRHDGEPVVTRLGERFEAGYRLNEVEAWRWLVTRSMWRFCVPNDSQMNVNKDARLLKVKFNFFDLVTRLICMIAAESAPANSLYFDELLAILNDDGMWGRTHGELYREVQDRRGGSVTEPSGHRVLLGDLEDEYSIGRDYMNTVFRKAFGQSGMFELTMKDGNKPVGICLSANVSGDPVLWRRLRYVLDNPVFWPSDDTNGEGTERASQ